MVRRLLRNYSRVLPLLLVPLILLLSACSEDSQPAKQEDPKPSKAEIQQTLESELPAFVQLTNFIIEVMENMGTKVDPDWRARFHATAQFAADTFARDEQEENVVLVQRVKRQGDTIEIFGKSRSQLFTGAWKTSLLLDGQPLSDLGDPKSSFAPSRVIIRESQAEADYFAQKEEARRLAERRAAEERRKMLVDAPHLIVGTWRLHTTAATWTIKEDGTWFVAQYDNVTARGNWELIGDLLKQTLEGQSFGVIHYEHRISQITSSDLVLVSSSDGTTRAARIE